MDAYSKLLQPLLETVLIVVLPAALGLLAVWIRAKTAEIQAGIPTEHLYFLRLVANNFVKAAEQTGLTAELKATGEQKKAEVLALLQAVADDHHIPVSVGVLEAIIETAVVDQFGYHEEDAPDLTAEELNAVKPDAPVLAAVPQG